MYQNFLYKLQNRWLYFYYWLENRWLDCYYKLPTKGFVLQFWLSIICCMPTLLLIAYIFITYNPRTNA